MAKHNGCPECQLQYGFAFEKENVEQQQEHHPQQDDGGEQRPSMTGQFGQTNTSGVFNPYYTGRPKTPANGSKHASIDRQEIIRRIKSGGSRSTSPELERPGSRSSLKKQKPSTATPASIEQDVTQTLPARTKSPELQQDDNQTIGLQIERPRSALHRGDFREKEQSTSAFERFGDSTGDGLTPALSTSPVAPWHPQFPIAATRQGYRPLGVSPELPPVQPSRSRAISNASLATSFVYKPPTSPLVQASRPDTPEPPNRANSRSPDKSRRHTFSPTSFQRFRSALEYPTAARQQPPALRAEKSFPYQAHQPQRSLNSFNSIPSTPLFGPRRPSLSESRLQHAAMVGSYEESILRGRMSTTPSKPLNFVAQIGVLGKGECKPNLKCPPHATVPFPAVFYSYGSGVKLLSTTDQPSPYVGLMDLENNLPPAVSSPDKRKQRLQAALSPNDSRSSSRTRDDNSNSDAQNKRRRRQKQKRRSASPKAPPGGSYRIPRQGQIQIVIKNPNKTAVKLFLVPYDLSDMEPGQKTFIRQRSYSAGPIVDMPLSSRKNLGTDRPEASLGTSDDPNERPMLRYLIHLHICCPSKGRYFLYKSIRVVFANRVPDGKERLRNEIQLPEPKYSAYKPGRDSNIGLTTTPQEAAAKTRSAIVDSALPGPPEPEWPQRHHSLAQSLPTQDFNAEFQLPLTNLNALPTLESRPSSRQNDDVNAMDLDSPSSLSSPASTSDPLQVVRKLDDPFRFERDRSRERKPGGRSESLLSRKLRDLAFQAQNGGAGDDRG